MIFYVILKDIAENFCVKFFLFSVYPLGSRAGSRSAWTFFGFLDPDPHNNRCGSATLTVTRFAQFRNSCNMKQETVSTLVASAGRYGGVSFPPPSNTGLRLGLGGEKSSTNGTVSLYILAVVKANKICCSGPVFFL